MRPDPLDDTCIEDLITSFLVGPLSGGPTVQLLEETEFNNALKLFVDKTDNVAITDYVNKQLQSTQKFLIGQEAGKTQSAGKYSRVSFIGAYRYFETTFKT